MCPRSISVETRDADNESTALGIEPGGPASLRTTKNAYTSATIHPEASSVKTEQRQRTSSIPVYRETREADSDSTALDVEPGGPASLRTTIKFQR